MTAINLRVARAASEHVALDTLAAENRALTEELAHVHGLYAERHRMLTDELAHMQAKLAAAMALADQAIRERDRLTEITDERVEVLAGWIADQYRVSDELRYYVRLTLNAIRETQ